MVTFSSPRNRQKFEVGKGIEALRHEEVSITHSISTGQTLVDIIGPFETDIDVMDVIIVVGTVPADDSSNAVDVFNGTVTGAVKIVTTVDPDGLTLQVPSSATVLGASNRVLAGTPITVRVVFGADDSAAPSTVKVRVGYDIPISQAYAIANT